MQALQETVSDATVQLAYIAVAALALLAAFALF